MVIRVISTITSEVTCYNCKSVLSYEFGDVRMKLVTDYGGGREMCRGIDCPVCKLFVEVK